MDVRVWVHEARIDVAPTTDPAAIGAAVTVALCGHWEHEGPCRWPHNNQYDAGYYRTIFVCTTFDEPAVRQRVRAALVGSEDWRVLSDAARAVATDESELAGQLLRAPRLSDSR